MGLALAAQWTRIRLPVQGTQDPWPGKVSHAWSNRPMHHKYVGATANEALVPTACALRRGQGGEKPEHHRE